VVRQASQSGGEAFVIASMKGFEIYRALENEAPVKADRECSRVVLRQMGSLFR
jgi:hypothetical protein